jgi:hypothetical protein
MNLLEPEDVVMTVDDEEDGGDGYERRTAREFSGLSSALFSGEMERTPTPSPEDLLNDSDSEIDIDNTSVVDETTYQDSTPKRRGIRNLPEEQEALGVSDAELRDAGWGDDHITLVQKIKMRGHEPLLPKHWQFSFRFWPDAFFAADNDAFISSVRNDHFKAEKALERLLDLGSRMRDSLIAEPARRPDLNARNSIKAYLKWALADSQLDPKTAIPLLAIETKPANVPAEELQARAIRKLEKLHARYTKAFTVVKSTEHSVKSSTSPELFYDVPTLYAIIASASLVALTVYTPEDPNERLKPVAWFDFKQPDYDAWNSLALAIIACHLRNVQMTIAEDTGLGEKKTGIARIEEEEEDPDR